MEHRFYCATCHWVETETWLEKDGMRYCCVDRGAVVSDGEVGPFAIWPVVSEGHFCRSHEELVVCRLCNSPFLVPATRLTDRDVCDAMLCRSQRHLSSWSCY